MLTEVYHARHRAMHALYMRDLDALDQACIEGIAWFEGVRAEVRRQQVIK